MARMVEWEGEYQLQLSVEAGPLSILLPLARFSQEMRITQELKKPLPEVMSEAGRSKQCWQKESPGTSISGFNAHTYPPTKTCGLMSFFFFAITKQHIEEICWSRPWAAMWMGKPNVNWVSLSSVFKSSLSCKEAPVQAHDLKHTTTPISFIL